MYIGGENLINYCSKQFGSEHNNRMVTLNSTIKETRCTVIWAILIVKNFQKNFVQLIFVHTWIGWFSAFFQKL